MTATEPEASRVRLAVVAPLTPTPSGTWLRLTPDTFAAEMAGRGLQVQVAVPDRLGAAQERTFTASFVRPKSFELAEVAKAVPELEALRALAESLAGSGLDVAGIVAKVVAVVGEGRLAEQIASTARPAAPPPPPAPPPAAPAKGDAVDAIFAAVDVKPAPPTAQGIEAFVHAVRRSGTPDGAGAPAPTRVVRQMIEDAIYGTAGDLLAAPAVARLEATWRGLKLLCDQCGSLTGLDLMVADCEPAAALPLLEQLADRGFGERADVVVLAEPVVEVERAAALAAVGEQLLAPVVIAYSPALLEGATPVAAANSVTPPPEAWRELRAAEASRWLCVVANPIVLVAEGSGVARRTLFGSPALALAAVLVQSYRETGTFARIVGTAGGLKVPGVWELPAGRQAGVSVPTQEFLSIDAQARLAALGILALGSGRNTDKIALSAVPTMRHSIDALPLPAQILTGQLVRLATWVRDEVPAGASDPDVVSMFEQAAEAFLFPGRKDEAQLKAKIDTSGGRRAVVLQAHAQPQIAGVAFELAFSLPLNS
jgi:type VI secretion system protein ImpC